MTVTDWSPTNNLVDHNFYATLYARVKEQFGIPISKTWTEKTDPQKFVYEDCGIATYICALKERQELDIKYFADIGCGNGLLTYLLTQLGLKGCGLDCRSRRIWPRFQVDADLRVCSMDPSNPECNELPKEVDFLVGNHCDEMTPWIPVMAARRKCGFFLLPCCGHDFFTKFQFHAADALKGVGKSEQYLNYIESLCRRLGFDCARDSLRISSTRRYCIIGRVPPQGLPDNLEDIISDLLRAASTTKSTFTPAPSVLPVRNCTAIPAEMQRSLAQKFIMALLSHSDEEINGWKCGVKMHLTEAMNFVTDEEKKQLRSQFGGLQTFFKNFHFLFESRDGYVWIRRWPEIYSNYRKANSTCWLSLLHPQGCPLPEEVCPLRHSLPQIRSKQTEEKMDV